MKGLSRVHFLLLAIVLAWSLNNSAMKIAMRSMEPLTFFAIRGAFASVAFLFIFFFLGGKWQLRRADIWRMCLLGFVGVTINQLFFTYGVYRTTAANASLLGSISPVFGLAFGIMLVKERACLSQWLGAFIALAGVALIIAGRGGQFSLGQESLLGDLLVLGGGMSWALYSVLCLLIVRKYSALQLTTLSWAFGYALGLPIAVEPALRTWRAITPEGWAMAIYVGVAMAVTFVLWNRAVAGIGAAKSLVFMNLLPVFGALFAVTLLGDTVTLMQVAGGAVTLAGVYVTQQRSG